MTEDQLRKLVDKRISLAESFLKTARGNLDLGDARSAVDRAYYAMHHAAHAALISVGVVEVRTHQGTITKFAEHFVKSGELSKLDSKVLRDAFDARQESTYQLSIHFGIEGAEKIVEDAEGFLQRIRDLIKST